MKLYSYLAPVLLLVAALGCGGPSTPPPDRGAPPGPRGAKPPSAVKPPAKPAKADLTPAQLLKQTMTELTARLKLKPGQANKVRAILAQDQAEKDRLQAKLTTTNNAQDMIKFFDLSAQVDRQTHAELAKVLSKDQMEGYLAFLKEQRKRLGAAGGSRSRGQMPMIRPNMGPGSGPNRP